MTVSKHLIRRYLLATLVGFVVGIFGLFADYAHFFERNRMHYEAIDLNAQQVVALYHIPSRRNEVRALLQIWMFLNFLTDTKSADNTLFSTVLLVPFTVYTFDVVAASRRKQQQGAA